MFAAPPLEEYLIIRLTCSFTQIYVVYLFESKADSGCPDKMKCLSSRIKPEDKDPIDTSNPRLMSIMGRKRAKKSSFIPAAILQLKTVRHLKATSSKATRTREMLDTSLVSRHR